MTWTPPDEVDEYQLLRPLGEGQTGQVWVALDTLLERKVAIKFIAAPDSVWLQRFLLEARAAARIQHPNVATLYRVGQVGDRAYLVSELIQGESLARVEKPLPPERVLHVANDLTRGLAAAHRAGILHRDIKPGNAVQTEAGDVKLLDFGLAKIEGIESARGPVGTPYFMAPEIWRGEEATARSDLWSLGALLFEMAAGKGPFRDVGLDTLPAVIQQRDARPLRTLAPAVEPRLSEAIDRCLARDPAQRFGSADQLLDAIEAIRSERWGAPSADQNPYRGLSAFQAEHRALFFGRRRDLRAALDRLRREPFLLVTGDSGVGKSSLCLAGLLPAIHDGALGDGRSFRTVRMVPGRRPLAALVSAMAPLLGVEPDALAEHLQLDPDRLARGLRRRIGRSEGLVLYIDQLEELVTVSREPETASRALAALVDDLPGIRLLASARADFLTRLAGLPGFGDSVQRSLYLLRGLRPDEIREAIVGPARITATHFESDALVARLVDSTEATESGLPLLQFALAELWQARDPQTRTITAASLDAVGGVSGALARHADGVVESLLPTQRAAARRLLLRLVTLEGTRARRSEEELALDPVSRGALDALVRARLVVAHEGSYEIAHEALLGGWGLLAGWLAEALEARTARHRLESAAQDWERAGRRRDLLWRRPQLEEVRGLSDLELTAREREFVGASRQQVRRSRLWSRALAVGFVGSLLLLYGGLRLKAGVDRARRLRAQLGVAQAAFERARALSAQLSAAQARAFALFDQRQRDLGEKTWVEVRSLRASRDAAFSAAASEFERAAALGPDDPAVRGPLADFLADRLRAESSPLRRAELRTRLALVDDGSRLQSLDAKATLVLQHPAAIALLQEGKEVPLGDRPLQGEIALPAGTALLTFAGGVRLLVQTKPGERLELVPRLPTRPIPDGFVYLPAGRFLFGTAAEESVREFFNTPPIHPVQTDAFLIARRETTWADWTAFLDALPPGDQRRRTPHVGAQGLQGELDLRKRAGHWQLTIKLGGTLQRLEEGQPLRLPARSRRALQDWRRLPVSGVSRDDARAYAAWLSSSGRVPGARLCTEHEWERAARGADEREFPQGDSPQPDDFDFDQTYGKRPDTFGPDEVGSHPASRSLYGVDDLAGNVWEWVDSSVMQGEAVARGGSYYSAANTCRSTNRELPEPGFRALIVGVRVCADAAPYVR